ncbi:hypothetical protein QYM36_007783 [Artemia franciscana]|uniref:Peroxisomal targeting signal 1 receptor n=1 Tax=Artemia franciscana TaxID=6661 RepID=A0AA88IT20_ARTSF|nr:hypothetical protein QYM36_007783 [Artemia franciscana]
MSMKELLAEDCGGRNPLLDAASHITRDQAFRQENLKTKHLSGYGTDELMVREFLEESKLGQEALMRRPPQSFQMQRLLQEVQEIEGSRQNIVQPGPSVSVITRSQPSSQWASEFLETAKEGNWIEEFNSQSNYGSHQGAFQDVWDTAKEMPLASDLLQQSETWATEFAEATSSVNNQRASEWVSEFKNEDIWDKMETDWQRAALDSPMDLPWLEASQSEQRANEYEFSDENPLSNSPNALEVGKQRRAEGDLSNAVLLFEAAVQKDPSLVEGWLLLGITLAENEQDREAIKALNRCLELDSNSLEARMAIAVSYTNEGLSMQACKALEESSDSSDIPET